MAHYTMTSDFPGLSKTRFTITNIDHRVHKGVTNIYLFCQGHISSEAADYVSSNLPAIISKNLKSIEKTNFTNILKNSFKQIQNEMMQNWANAWPKLEDGHNSLSGTSATVALVTNKFKLIVGHVGGSSLFFTRFNRIQRNTQSTKVTPDHLFTNPDEMTKIFQSSDSPMDNIATKLETDEMATAGECCFLWDKTKCICQPNSVNPSEVTDIPMISLTRTLGDYWNYRVDIGNRIISHEPSVNVANLKKASTSKYLIFVTRKLASVITEEEISAAITMKENGAINDPAEYLIMTVVLHIRNGGQISSDSVANMTVLVIPLQNILQKNSFEHDQAELAASKNFNSTGNCNLKNNTASSLYKTPRKRQKFYYWTNSRKLLKRYLINIIRRFKHRKRKYKKIRRPFRQNFKCTAKKETTLSKIHNSPSPSDVTVNIVKWMKCSQISNYPLAIKQEPCSQSIPQSTTAAPFSLNVDLLQQDKMYILCFNSESQLVFQFSANEIHVPEDLQFYKLPSGRSTNKTNHAFHISENVVLRGDIMSRLKSPLATIFQNLLKTMNCPVLENLELENNLHNKINESQKTVANLEDNSNKTLLFTVPINQTCDKTDSQNAIKVFLLHDIIPNKVPAIKYETTDPAISLAEPSNILSTNNMESNPTDSEHSNGWDKNISLPPIPQIDPTKQPKPIVETKIFNTTKYTPPPPKQSFLNRRNENDSVTTSKKNSVSCAFVTRGCGGKCIIPGANKGEKVAKIRSPVNKETNQEENIITSPNCSHKNVVLPSNSNVISNNSKCIPETLNENISEAPNIEEKFTVKAKAKVETETSIVLHIPESLEYKNCKTEFKTEIKLENFDAEKIEPHSLPSEHTPIDDVVNAVPNVPNVKIEKISKTLNDVVKYPAIENTDHDYDSVASCSNTLKHNKLKNDFELKVKLQDTVGPKSITNNDRSPVVKVQSPAISEVVTSIMEPVEPLCGSGACQQNLNPVAFQEERLTVYNINAETRKIEACGFPSSKESLETTTVETLEEKVNEKSELRRKSRKRKSCQLQNAPGKIRINAESIRKNTGKKLEECLPEPKAKGKKAKAVAEIDLD